VEEIAFNGEGRNLKKKKKVRKREKKKIEAGVMWNFI
jgi:hypothetical protein